MKHLATRFAAVVSAAVMCISLMPASVYAEDTTDTDEFKESAEPSAEVIQDLDVNVGCLENKHEVKTYKMGDHYTMSEINNYNSNYRPEYSKIVYVTPDEFAFMDMYNKDTGTSHILGSAPGYDTGFSYLFGYRTSTGKWERSQEVPNVSLTCDTSNEPSLPFSMLSSMIKDKVILKCTTSSKHPNKKYDLLEGAYQGSYGLYYTDMKTPFYEIKINPEKYAAQYSKDMCTTQTYTPEENTNLYFLFQYNDETEKWSVIEREDLILKTTCTAVNDPNSQPMYRLYNPNSSEHFYTADASERDYLVSIGWEFESIGWIAPKESKTPVYRLYNPVGGEHHYTSNAEEKDNLVKEGWNYEKIGWYSDDAEGVAVYRQYNPNMFSNNHNYTADTDERDHLISLGWHDEKVAWYGVKQ